MNPLAVSDHRERNTRSEARGDAISPTDPIALEVEGAASADLPTVANQIPEKASLDEVLEEALVATGATGAAIALVRGAQMVCCATTGTDAPDLGTAIDPATGLTGCCILTREIQQCNDTETNPHVDLEACRRLGVRAIMVLPLLDSDSVVGVFEILSSQPDAFGLRDLDRLQALANRILDGKPPRSKGEPAVPPKDHAVDPMRGELLAREVFLASAQRNTGKHRSNYWMLIHTSAVIALAVLLGWLLGHAAWEMAVDRAEHQISDTQKDLQPASQVAPDIRSETSSLSEKEAGTLP